MQRLVPRLHTLKLIGYGGDMCELFDLTTGESFSAQFAVTDVKVLMEGGVHGGPRLALVLDCPIAVEINPAPSAEALPLTADGPRAPFRKGEDVGFPAADQVAARL